MVSTPVRTEEARKTIMDAVDVLTSSDTQQLQKPMLGASAELRQTLCAPAPAAATDMETATMGRRKRTDTLGGFLSKSVFDSETEDVN